jgi:hypothetical protein
VTRDDDFLSGLDGTDQLWEAVFRFCGAHDHAQILPGVWLESMAIFVLWIPEERRRPASLMEERAFGV